MPGDLSNRPNVADLVERIQAFQESVRIRRTRPAAPGSLAGNDPLVARLEALDPDLARSYRQALTDLEDSNRLSFLGPAGEIREVMRGVMHKLAPDRKVKKQKWFVGEKNGNPTQAERIRFIVQGGDNWKSANSTAETVEEKVGRLGRSLYGRASKAFHAGTQRREVEKILGYVRALLDEMLPPLAT